MLTEKQIACPFCGKQRFMSVDPDIPQEELEEMVIENCDCDAALAACGMKETEKAITDLLTEKSVDRGYPHEVAEETIDMIRKICKAILDGHMNKVSFTEPNGDVIKLKKHDTKVEIARIFKIDRRI